MTAAVTEEGVGGWGGQAAGSLSGVRKAELAGEGGLGEGDRAGPGAAAVMLMLTLRAAVCGYSFILSCSFL